jgi:hypothetical protein
LKYVLNPRYYLGVGETRRDTITTISSFCVRCDDQPCDLDLTKTTMTSHVGNIENSIDEKDVIEP